ncbi:MAG: type 2 lanthipeptide synthetase LanM [Paraclostridium sordellii]
MYSVEEMIEKSINNEQTFNIDLGAFDNFQNPFINFFKIKLNDILNKYSFCINNKNELLDSFCNNLKINLVQETIRTLIFDFNEDYPDIYETLGNEEYQLKNDSFKYHENILNLLLKYPVLKYIIELEINYKLKLISDVFERLNSDKDEIEDLFRFKINDLIEVSLGEGDLHNNGQSVVQLVFNDSNRIIYKPRSLKVDIIYNELLKWINSKNEKSELFIVKNLDKNHYGWQDYINHTMCKSQEEVEHYFYSTGELLSVLYLLNSSDMHYENLICHGKYPVLIDLETLMTNRSNNEIGSFLEYLTNSVLSTLMIPNKVKSKQFDIEISGLGGINNDLSENMKSFCLKDVFKNSISLEKFTIETTEKLNRVLLNEQVMCPEKFLYKIEEGFKDVCNLILSNKEKFLKIIKTIQDGHIRQVLKATVVYGAYLDASLHPKYLSNYDNYDMIFNILYKDDSKVNDLLTKGEISVLKNRNIPYFYTKINSNNLYYTDIDNKEKCIEEYYKDSIWRIIKEKVLSLNENIIENQLRLIRLSFVKEGLTEYNSNNRITYSKDYLQIINEIISKISMYTFYIEDKSYLVDLSLDTDLNLAVINSSLYEGGSILLLLNYYADYTQNDTIREMAKKLLCGIRNSCPLFKSEILSAYNGIGSLIYIYYNLYKLWGEKEYLDEYYNLLNELKSKIQNDDYTINIDFINGILSLIVLLSKLYKYDNNSDIITIITKLLEILERVYTLDPLNNSGLAHGYSGVALAFILGGDVIDNKRLVDFGKNIVLIENKLYQPKLRNWRDTRKEATNDLVYWCYGATGIGISRNLMKEVINDQFILDDLNIATQKVKMDGVIDIENDSMCHGFFGNIDMLNIVGEIDKRINTIIEDKLKQISSNGFKDGYNANGDILGVFVGIGGVAFTLLRLLNNKYPSLLSLDIYTGEKNE